MKPEGAVNAADRLSGEIISNYFGQPAEVLEGVKGAFSPFAHGFFQNP
jgi:hypothetical protein